MKKLIGILVIAALAIIPVIGLSVNGTHWQPRAASGVGNALVVVVDTNSTNVPASARTSVKDTFFSDTLTLFTVDEIHYTLNCDSITFCDSCNDSALIIIQACSQMPGDRQARVLVVDTFGAGAASFNATVAKTSKNRFIPNDSLYGTQFFFRTIVKDTNFVHAIGANATKDTLLVQNVWLNVFYRY